MGIIAHVAGTSSAIERSEGFIARMKEKYPDIQVLPVQYSDGDPQKAMDKTIDMIQPTRILQEFMAQMKAQRLA